MGLLAPGVHVVEDVSISIRIGSAPTAVPVFVVGDARDEDWWLEAVGPIKLTSFNEYINYVIPPTGATFSPVVSIGLSSIWRKKSQRRLGPAHRPLLSGSEKKSSTHESRGIDANKPWDRMFAPALKAYFDNGGGYCYLCPRDKLELVEGLTDVTLIVQCGQTDATGEILKVCQPGSGRFALLDFPLRLSTSPVSAGGSEEVMEDDAWKFEGTNFNKEDFDLIYKNLTPSDCAAVYYPWLKANWTVMDKEGSPAKKIHLVAPSAVAAGLICRTDEQLGPWKAPANSVLSSGLTPSVKIGDATQALYTSSDNTTMSINMIRSFPGQGTKIWGARTLTTGGSNWNYINVRRTFDMIERDISKALEAVLFEPNGPATWEIVRAAIDNYLFTLWQKGAIYGETPSEGYFIQIGEGVTMTKSDIDSGYLRVRVGVAVVRPAEFVILEFTQRVISGD